MVLTNSRNRTTLWTAGGLLAGFAIGAAAMMSLRGGDGPYATSPPSTRSMGAAPAAPSFVTAVASNCDMPPVLPNAGESDGQAVLQNKPAETSGHEVASLILVGKESAAAGRQRDAEVSFLNACRKAAALRDSDGVPLADAMYQLARHYANVAAFGAPRSRELLERADRLYSASLEGFRSRLGPQHEKTRFAQEGLVTVRQVTAGQGTAKAVAETPPVARIPAEDQVVAAPPRERLKEPEPAPAAKAPVKAPVAKEPPSPPPVAQRRPPTRSIEVEEETGIAAPAPSPRQARRPRPAEPELEPEDHGSPPPPATMGGPGRGDVPTAEGSIGQP